MENKLSGIKLFGSGSCHKTEFYRRFLDDIGIPYDFFDVLSNPVYTDELRNLYENRKLNFPTITIGKKKLRNLPQNELLKWLNKLIPDRLMVTHDKENKRFLMNVDEGLATVEYILKNGKMYLVHSEVPSNLCGKALEKSWLRIPLRN